MSDPGRQREHASVETATYPAAGSPSPLVDPGSRTPKLRNAPVGARARRPIESTRIDTGSDAPCEDEFRTHLPCKGLMARGLSKSRGDVARTGPRPDGRSAPPPPRNQALQRASRARRPWHGCHRLSGGCRAPATHHARPKRGTQPRSCDLLITSGSDSIPGSDVICESWRGFRQRGWLRAAGGCSTGRGDTRSPVARWRGT